MGFVVVNQYPGSVAVEHTALLGAAERRFVVLLVQGCLQADHSALVGSFCLRLWEVIYCLL